MVAICPTYLSCLPNESSILLAMGNPSALAFCHLLKSLMARRGLTAVVMAGRLKMSQAMLSRILSGQRQPEKDLEPWAAILGLDGLERHDFLVLGYLARSNPYLAGVIEDQRAEIGRLKKRLEATRASRAESRI